MALEAVVSSEGLFGCWSMAASGGAGGWSWGHAHGGATEMEVLGNAAAAAATWDAGAISSSSVLMQGPVEEPAGSSAAPPLAHGGNAAAAGAELAQEGGAAAAPAARRKRSRAKIVKNKEEVESQRMTHIAVERNRRKQMNEYLAALRSLMPPSYVQRGDQASIIGGAINYVKEMEQLVQSLEARKHIIARNNLSPGAAAADDAAAMPPCFAGFFTFPQYSMSTAGAGTGGSPPATTTATADAAAGNATADGGNDADAAAGSRPSSVADIEVTIVESHANLRLLSRRRPRQLLRLVAGLQGHRLTVLHLNVTSAGAMALYSLNLKVEDDCRLASVNDIAAAVHRIVEAIEREEKEQTTGELGSSETERGSSIM